MRGIAKENAIRSTRLKLIQIAIFQNKAFPTKRPEIRDRQLASKVKLKRSQIQDRAQEDSIRDITCSADSIGPKASRSPMLIEHHTSHLN
jgi:hypothetical protein